MKDRNVLDLSVIEKNTSACWRLIAAARHLGRSLPELQLYPL